MSETRFTPEQQDAIRARGENLLVAAGAGSGKTTVLVERIIQRLLAGGDVQRLLVLTFTHAAADDMRGKIQRALARLCREHPTDAGYRRQLALLPQAHISTVHSFCLDLLRTHYYRVGLPAGFRVASEVEMSLLRRECLEACLDQAYGDPDIPMADLADAYGGVHDDSQLEQLILDLYAYSQSRPDPEQWLWESAGRLLAGETVDGLAGAEALRRQLHTQVELALGTLRQGEALPDIPLPYRALAEREIDQAERILEGRSLQEQVRSLSELTFERLPSGAKKLAEGYPPGHIFDEAQMQRFKKLRDGAKNSLRKLAARFGDLTRPEVVEEQHRTGLLLTCLVERVLDLGQRLRQAKLERGWIDYGDMEHLTLALLSEADFAAELAQGFDEVLIDEYQDINQVQEAIFARLRQSDNFFAVGDVKQSVYRFRLAEPQLFLDKYIHYGQGEGGRRIDLNRNFRSQVRVIQGVNHLFRQLMTAEVAELDYDEAAALRPGREEIGPPPELWLVQRSADPDRDDENEGAIQLEARQIARRIRQLREEGYAYRDMAILLRSLKSSRDLMVRELDAAGIPVLSEGAGGYLDSPELDMALSLLKIIDNPRQDPALAGVLRSPLVGFLDEDLLELRMDHPEGCLWEALTAAGATDTPLGAKCRAFRERLAEWRRLGGELRPSVLLLRLYEEAGFYHLCGALSGGETRQGHLRCLYQQACAYERQGYAGLYRFICQVEDSRAWGKGDLSPSSDGTDGVRLMSIHKSKGLEFPVVFVAALNTGFNFQDEYADVIWDRDLGLGARFSHRELRKKYPTPAHGAIAGKKHAQALAEELRVYYVALTRARERLILTACLPDVERAVTKWAEVLAWPEERLPLQVLAQARRPLDWFGPALVRHPAFQGLVREAGLTPAARTWGESAWSIQVAPALSPEEAVSGPPAAPAPAVPSPELDQAVTEALTFRYPDKAHCGFPAKWSVSALNRQGRDPALETETALTLAARQETEEAWLDREPALETETALTLAARLETEEARLARDRAAERGTAYHRILELADLSRVDPASLREQVRDLVDRGKLAPEGAALVDVRRLAGFFASPLGQRLCAAPRVQRETAFTMLEEEQGQQVVVQGMLDAAFLEPEGWVLLDYKTGGRDRSDEELRQLYAGQVEQYRQAIQRLWRAPVKEAYLCMLDSGRVVRV